ncbi:hypothetical protein HYFRA_00011498 [Hymenoscyphus fraxineus]|uniref:Rhodopsin domain-containing protein n=1 Tax=Hymenoscyphus fraxineus TaxID=746836 RepID=A0A9N9PYG3_9HELO|nr:hypothetical protein HYFRA_00011498 [Hymenoscyphus fraxineus]
MGIFTAEIAARAADTTALAGTPSVSPRELLIAGIIMLSFTGVFVFMRIANNLSREQKQVSDLITLLSFCFLGTFVGLSYYMNQYLFANLETSLKKLLLFSQIANWVAALAMWCSKAPILFLFIQLFGVQPRVSILSYMTLAVLGVAVIIAASVTTGKCNLGNNPPSPTFLLDCSKTASQVGVGLGIISVVVDLIIMLIPIPILIKLMMPMHKKVGLVIIFTSGVFALIASSISVYYKWESKDGLATNETAAMVCTIVESCIATIVGCIPATYRFWAHVVLESSVYMRFASMFSSQKSTSGRNRSRQSRQTRVPDKFKPVGSDGASSTERIHDYTIHIPQQAQSDLQPHHNTTEIPLDTLQQRGEHQV